jgi:hypothetical protein
VACKSCIRGIEAGGKRIDKMAKKKEIIPPSPELPEIRVVNIEEVLTQRRNTNKGKPGGDEAIERSIRKFGAVRPGAASVNEDGNVEMFAGSHALKSAQAAGFSEVLLIPHDGTRYPILVRTDFDPVRDAAKIHEASLADNQSHELSYEIDFGLAEEIGAEFGFSIEDWGVVAPGDDVVDKVNNGNPDEWVGMPEFDPIENPFKLMIHFESEEDRRNFEVLFPQIRVDKKQGIAWSTWFPFKERDDLRNIKYELA